MSAPTTLTEYREWARTILAVDYDKPAVKTRYETNVQTALNEIQKSAFWIALPIALEQSNKTHEARTSTGMLMSGEITLTTKPYESAVDKSFRYNVLRNRNFPLHPRHGWVTPDTWYTAFDDLIRTTVVCKFMDGPENLATCLTDHGNRHGLTSESSPRANDRGYYAYHHYTTFPVTMADASWNPQLISLKLELQLTTQLQEVLRSLTHPLYERTRLSTEPQNDKWKWDYDNPRFQTSYLGHTLHLIEAVIIQVRTAAHLTHMPTASHAGNPPAPNQAELSTASPSEDEPAPLSATPKEEPPATNSTVRDSENLA